MQDESFLFFVMNSHLQNIPKSSMCVDHRRQCVDYHGRRSQGGNGGSTGAVQGHHGGSTGTAKCLFHEIDFQTISIHINNLNANEI